MKCIANDQPELAAKILTRTEPYQAKEIGDRVKFNKEKWSNRVCEETMKKLLEAKFSTGSDMAKHLLDTGNKYLAESGRGHFWACGLSLTHKDILKKSEHPGSNKLGKLLMSIRSSLQEH